MRRWSLLLAAGLLATVRSDVSHVLDGSAHPPVAQYSSSSSAAASASASASAYTQSGYAQPGFGQFGGVGTVTGSENVPGSVAFWWADGNSPFKHAYEHFKKCSLKGNCFPPVSPDFKVRIYAKSMTCDSTSNCTNTTRSTQPILPLFHHLDPYSS